MVSVIKRSGRRQMFSPAKIRGSISGAARGARVAPMRTRELVRDIAQPVSNLVRRKKVMKVTEIRKSILGRLDRQLKAVSDAWRRYEKNKK